MKFCSSGLAFLISSLGLCTLNFAVSLPAQAAIACEPGTIIKYPNGSLATCEIAQNMTVQIASSSSGISNIPCKAHNYISFDDQGQFKSCRLETDIKIIRGNSRETCPAEYKVNVAVAKDGNLEISCQPYY